MATTDLDRGHLEDEYDDSYDVFDEEELEDGGQMTLVEHLTELRRRLAYSVLAVTVTSIVAFIFHDRLIAFLMLPLAGTHTQLQNFNLTEGFTVVFKVSVGVGIALAAPIWLYQTWGFISPALTRKERKHAMPFTLIGVGLFIVGLAVGFFTLRFPIAWLIGFGRDSGFNELISADSYLSFVTFFMLAFGAVFELPLVLTFLSVIGILSSEKLAKNRSVALVGLWVLSCIITPGADPYTPVIVGAALTFLYFVSEILIRAIGK